MCQYPLTLWHSSEFAQDSLAAKNDSSVPNSPQGREPMRQKSRFNPTAELSPDRAYVVQLREESMHPRAALAGRVEHISSGRFADFSSAAELEKFLHTAPDGMAASDLRAKR